MAQPARAVVLEDGNPVGVTDTRRGSGFFRRTGFTHTHCRPLGIEPEQFAFGRPAIGSMLGRRSMPSGMLPNSLPLEMIGVKTNAGAFEPPCPASASIVRTLSLGMFQNSAIAESGIEIPIRSPIRIISARSRLCLIASRTASFGTFIIRATPATENSNSESVILGTAITRPPVVSLARS